MLIRKLYKDERGSPLVEEGLLIGLGIVIFLTILALVTGIMNWLEDLGNQLPGVMYSA